MHNSLGYGQLLVKVEAAPVNPSDLLYSQGKYRGTLPKPKSADTGFPWGFEGDSDFFSSFSFLLRYLFPLSLFSFFILFHTCCVVLCSGSGTVVATGSGLLPWMKLGQRVGFASDLSDGGSYAEYVVVSALHIIDV